MLKIFIGVDEDTFICFIKLSCCRMYFLKKQNRNKYSEGLTLNNNVKPHGMILPTYLSQYCYENVARGISEETCLGDHL